MEEGWRKPCRKKWETITKEEIEKREMSLMKERMSRRNKGTKDRVDERAVAGRPASPLSVHRS